MAKVHHTNISKKMKIEEIIGLEERLIQEMLSFFEGERDPVLRKCYEYLVDHHRCDPSRLVMCQ